MSPPSPGAGPDSTAPLVSVLVPLFNHARFIGDCLDSIYHDDWPSIEVIIVDDGSKDASADAARLWREAHPGRFRDFRVIEQENRGVARTLNRLVGESRGEFLAPLASDDLLLRGGLRARVRALDDNPAWLAVFGDAVVVDGEGTRVAASALRRLGAEPAILADPEFLACELIVHWAVPGPVFMARREAYDPARGIGLYVEDLTVEDKDFYLRLAARGALGFIDECVAAYRLHAMNASTTGAHRDRVIESLCRTDAANAPRFRSFCRLALRVSSLRHRCADPSRRRTPIRWLERKLIGALWRAITSIHHRRIARAGRMPSRRIAMPDRVRNL